MNNHQKPLIMLVENEEIIRRPAKGLLEQCGYQVETYENGLAAHNKLSKLQKSKAAIPYDLVLSDIDMPEMDGLTLAEKAADLAPNTPFILMTCFPREQYPKNVKAVIIKPFLIEQLIKVIGGYLS